MDRSGTSMTSSLVQRWARYDGDPCKRTIIDLSNPKGYYESRDLEVALADAIFHILDHQEVSCWSPVFNERLQNLVTDNTHFVGILEHEFQFLHDIGIPWCSKTPLLSVTVALWKHFVSNPVLVITVRNPYDTAKSLLKFENKKESREKIALNLLRWQHYLMRILKDTAKFERRIFVSYDEVIENPQQQITKLGNFLEQQFPKHTDSQSAIKDMLAMVEPSLHRNNTHVSFEMCEEATQTQKELYAHLVEMTESQTESADFDYDRFQLTEQEIRFLEKNELYIYPDVERPKFFKYIWNVCKYKINQYKHRNGKNT